MSEYNMWRTLIWPSNSHSRKKMGSWGHKIVCVGKEKPSRQDSSGPEVYLDSLWLQTMTPRHQGSTHLSSGGDSRPVIPSHGSRPVGLNLVTTQNPIYRVPTRTARKPYNTYHHHLVKICSACTPKMLPYWAIIIWRFSLITGRYVISLGCLYTEDWVEKIE